MDKVTNEQQPGGRPAEPPPQGALWELPDYAHERELGAGASGRVVLAHHRATGTPVAIKYLLGDHPDRAAFRVEAQLLAALDSPHVTRLYEYVESPHGAAIVMELVEGISLRDLLRAEGETGPEAALVVLKGSLLGLAAAHRAGVVHRDYKPGNVLVTVDGESKLVDFGIAVRTGASGTVAGTPAYMAPEQWAGQAASPATDVYAATATFFECLTGAKPYAGTTLMELAVQHTEAAIPDTQAPEALRPLIRAGLAKTPAQRPAGAEALVVELEALAGAAYGADWEDRGRRRLAALVAALPLLLPTPLGDGALPGATSYATTVLAPPAPRPRPPLRAGLIATIGALVLIAGALAVVANAGESDATTAPKPAAAPRATTSLGAPAPSTSPPPTDTPSASPSASPSDSPSPTADDTPTASPTSKPSTTPKPSTSGTTTAPPPPSPTPTVSTAPPVTVSLIRQTLNGTGASVRATVTGAGTTTLTFSWYDAGDKSGKPVAVTKSAPLSAGTSTQTSGYPFACRSWTAYVIITSDTSPPTSVRTANYSYFCIT
ncbi:serine/threonine-protein kinase [Streptomyces sp. TLI_171]|uniref:serine/threonine-protein kinase n=1 Tax=Streptomyces sp. TLI_171 TaxID=1938859 RepID=UPI000C5D60F0|nr:serine/threonine-protein kinase [Streptomyces sp. TLI_171]RKE17176.1 serine/threonine-protein kinase [Streptomyces sp. TLI_171]